MDLFEVKIKYQPCGKQEEVTETYLVDAVSFTDAESLIVEEVSPYSDSAIQVLSERKSGVSEVLNINGIDSETSFYKGKISVLADAAKEKYCTISYYIAARDMRHALDILQCECNSMADTSFEVELKKTNIYDLIKK